jgi:hypothetical protein
MPESNKEYESREKFEPQIAIAKEAFGTHPPSPLPMGIGFLCWQLERSMSRDEAEELLSTTLKHDVQAIWLSFGLDLKHWIDYIRQKSGTTKIFVQINTLEDALIAIHDWKVDVVVAQGLFFFLFHIIFELTPCTFRYSSWRSRFGHGPSALRVDIFDSCKCKKCRSANCRRRRYGGRGRSCCSFKARSRWGRLWYPLLTFARKPLLRSSTTSSTCSNELLCGSYVGFRLRYEVPRLATWHN